MEYQLVRISRIACIMMILLSIGFTNHVIIAPVILDNAGRDAWLSVLLTAILLPFWLLLIYPMIRSIGTQSLLAWLDQRTNSVTQYIIVAVFCLLLAMIAISTTVDTVEWGMRSYLPNTPLVFTSSIFVILCVASAILGIHVIAYVSCLLLPFVVLLGIFVSSANTNLKDYSQLFPILEHGWTPVVNGMVIVAAGFVELLLFVLFQGYVNKPFKKRHLLITAGIIVVLSVGPLIGALTEFGSFEATELRYPAYGQWRLVYIGKYFEHVDFFAIYQWISGAFIRTASSMALVMDLLALTNRIKRGIAGGFIGLIGIVLVTYPLNEELAYRFYSHYIPIMLCAFLAICIMLTMIAAFGKKGEAAHDTSNGA